MGSLALGAKCGGSVTGAGGAATGAATGATAAGAGAPFVTVFVAVFETGATIGAIFRGAASLETWRMGVTFFSALGLGT